MKYLEDGCILCVMSMDLEATPPDYRGIPLLTRFEGVCLRLRLDEVLCADEIPITYIGDMVVRNCAAIEAVIVHDMRQFLTYEADMDMSDDEVSVFADGIRDGYNFFIGCMTWIRMTRSQEVDPTTFIHDSRYAGSILHVSRTELARIKQVRAGAAPIEHIEADDEIQSSSDLSVFDAGDYCFESESFEDVLIEHTDTMASHPDQSKDPYVSGLFHGVANAIEMYIQLHEERILAQAR